jgi:hypothetical protein
VSDENPMCVCGSTLNEHFANDTCPGSGGARFFQQKREADPLVLDKRNLKYSDLHRVLMAAYERATTGKGAERHADNRSFLDQPMITIGRTVGVGFCTGQALKKIEESTRLDRLYSIPELLDAIVYLAGAVILLEEGD